LNLNIPVNFRSLHFAVRFLLALAATAAAQQPSPAPSAPPLSAPIVIIAPVASPTAAASPAEASPPAPAGTPSRLKKIGVKIMFVPPPMEGTISLGIYDGAGKLVRTLHREASGDEFVAALDGYITHWDGNDDAGQPLPPGHYSAAGYMVGAVSVRALPAVKLTGSGPTLAALLPSLKFPDGKPFAPQEKIVAGLVANPLDRDREGSAELSAAYDAKGSWLQLSSGLPLKQISATPGLQWVALGRSAPGQPLVLFQSDGATLEEFVITKVADMMAFDCGGLDWAVPGH